MVGKNLSVEEFQELLPQICDSRTSADSDGWVKENPLWGHCAVVTLLAQDRFGGEILRASLENTPFAAMRSHYWNKLSDGREIDFTRSQFGDQYPGLTGEVRTREYVLSNTETEKRYQRLRQRLWLTLIDP